MKWFLDPEENFQVLVKLWFLKISTGLESSYQQPIKGYIKTTKSILDFFHFKKIYVQSHTMQNHGWQIPLKPWNSMTCWLYILNSVIIQLKDPNLIRPCIFTVTLLLTVFGIKSGLTIKTLLNDFFVSSSNTSWPNIGRTFNRFNKDCYYFRW